MTLKLNLPPENALTAKQERALLALIKTGSPSQAAVMAGVGEASIHRWLQQPEFVSQYRAARRNIVDGTVSQLPTDSRQAAGILLDIAKNSTSDAARVSACRIIISQAIDAVALVDLQERVDELERIAKGGTARAARTDRIN